MKERLENFSVFRVDRRNVGDWWSPPVRYFPLRARTELDMVGDLAALDSAGIVIVGGGGLAQQGAAMRDGLACLAREDRPYRLIAWGVGGDTVTNRASLLSRSSADPGLYRAFDSFDVVGTRIHSEDDYGGDPRYRWVPCASSMHPMLLELRQSKPVNAIGVYAHRRVPIPTRVFSDIARPRGQRALLGMLPRADNTGMDIAAKLRFLARFEFIVTNSYHGVYWATLLGRKVICLAFKNGLFSFRHAPAYFDPAEPSRAFDEAQAYPDAIDECRDANIGFYRYLIERYGDF